MLRAGNIFCLSYNSARIQSVTLIISRDFFNRVNHKDFVKIQDPTWKYHLG
jgi:hypothetical protein